MAAGHVFVFPAIHCHLVAFAHLRTNSFELNKQLVKVFWDGLRV
jgi:hypothetical protein